MEVTTTTLATIISDAVQLAGGVGDMFDEFKGYFFFWMPMAMTVFAFLMGSLKSMMFFRKRRRGR